MQCKKQDLLYKTTAIDVTGHVIEVLDIDVFQELYSILVEVMDTNFPEEKQSSLTSKEMDEILDLKAKSYEALGKSWPKDINLQLQYLPTLLSSLPQKLKNSTWKIQASILKALTTAFERLKSILIYMIVMISFSDVSLINYHKKVLC